MAQQMRQIPLTVEPTNPKPRDEPWRLQASFQLPDPDMQWGLETELTSGMWVITCYNPDTCPMTDPWCWYNYMLTWKNILKNDGVRQWEGWHPKYMKWKIKMFETTNQSVFLRLILPKKKSSSNSSSHFHSIWQCVKTLYPCSSQNSWDLWMFILLKNCINRYWSIPICW